MAYVPKEVLEEILNEGIITEEEYMEALESQDQEQEQTSKHKNK